MTKPSVRTIGSEIPEKPSDAAAHAKLLGMAYDKLLQDLPTARKVKEAIYNTLNFVLECDIGFQAALHAAVTSDRNEIVDFESEVAWMVGVQRKVSRLMFLENLMLNVGFPWHAEVMRNTVDLMFPSTTTPSPGKSPKVPVEDLLRQLAQGSRAPSVETIGAALRKELDKRTKSERQQQQRPKPKNSDSEEW